MQKELRGSAFPKAVRGFDFEPFFSELSNDNQLQCRVFVTSRLSIKKRIELNDVYWTMILIRARTHVELSTRD